MGDIFGDIVTLKQRFLGRGQFGTVQLAETASGHEVAVKRIDLATMTSPQLVKNLQREVDLLRGVDHPNICRLFAQ